MPTSYSNPISDNRRSKKNLLGAIFLGLLTFVITPLVAFILTIPFFFIDQIPESFNPIVIIAGIFGLNELGGFFLAQFIFILLLTLIGNFITAIISWFINGSRKMAAITFFSAFFFQFIVVAFTIPSTMEQSLKTIESGIEAEKSYQQFAEIGDIGYEIQPYPASVPIGNTFPEYGPMGEKLQVIVPISVDQEGTYLVTAQYRTSKGRLKSNTPINNTTQYLSAGDNVVRVEFNANESGGSYGFWSPSYVGGTAQIQLFYLASEKEVLDKITSNQALDKRIIERFLEDEGLDRRAAQTEPTVNKFVGRKIFEF